MSYQIGFADATGQGVERWMFGRSGLEPGSDGSARRAAPGTLIGNAVFGGANVEQPGQGVGIGVGERLVGSFDAPQRVGGDSGRGSQLGLSQAANDPPIARVALAGRNRDDLAAR